MLTLAKRFSPLGFHARPRASKLVGGRLEGLLLVLFLTSCAPGTGPAPEPEPEPEPKPTENLLLITVDTWRADTLGVDEYGIESSPHLNRFAEQAIVFENAYATAPFTGPSHASMFTSQHPSTHGHIYNGHRSEALEASRGALLAEHVAQAGFRTAAFVSAGPLEEKYGFGEGFEEFQRIRKTDDGDKGAGARHVNDAALPWLERRRDGERFFLWVHYFESHLPYVCAEEVERAFELSGETPTHTNVRTIPPELLRRAYHAEVFENDRAIGGLLAHLEKLGLDESTAVAIVADHGEYLGEHGLVDHSRLFDEVLHVPMMIRLPHLSGAQRKETVSTLDLAPTLLGALGLPPLPEAQGRDLGSIPGTNPPEIPVFAEWRHFRMLEPGSEPRPADFQISVQLGTKKLIRDVLFPQKTMFFDHAIDPGESRDLKKRLPQDYQHLQSLLDEHIRASLPQGILGVDRVEIDSQSRKMLQSLGYLE